MNIKKLTLKSPAYPEALRHSKGRPAQLFYMGDSLPQLLKRPCIAIVGTRYMTPYGKQVTQDFARALAEQGLVIISGLAYGVDTEAHRAALDVSGLAIGVLPGPLDNIVPHGSRRLARQIVEQGGALVSEYPSGIPPQKQNFVARNRIMSGLAKAVLITEAGEGSGAIHTANFALNQGKTVLAVPGNITNLRSTGVNNLIKSGALLVNQVSDVLQAMGLISHQTPAQKVQGRNAGEQAILDLLLQGINEGDQLLTRSGLDISVFNQHLTMLEISGKIRALGANYWGIA